MTSITATLASVGDVSVTFAPPPVASLRDAELLTTQRTIAEVRRRLDALAATVAGEIAHRSRRELGHTGLAQANGQRTVEGLISQLTGSSTRDARTLVKAAELLPVASVSAAGSAGAAPVAPPPRPAPSAQRPAAQAKRAPLRRRLSCPRPRWAPGRRLWQTGRAKGSIPPRRGRHHGLHCRSPGRDRGIATG